MGLLHSLASLLLASSTALAVTTSPTATEPCLSQPEAANIALRWFSIFQTDGNGTGTGAALVNSTLSPDFQWQTNSLSANATNVTVPVGTPITYFGTDYLEVDLATRLIYNATSSSDLPNYYKQLGYNVLA
ncbi:unnamed protein product [Zymoseptoria tritici ST99CH_3D7]|uniref:Uncharacterized protein n=1 Tax=Zymoseptoria tritici (strain ST99CH_3D7) TaxID=1276538 RepID=A0A1X7RQ07_ZYMT9|nr:unnamed protein product [Zymoseptoria tritici ST99CH_3D7]